jgi:stage V sporulation protein AD
MKNIIKFYNKPKISYFASIGGVKEGEGPLRDRFDFLTKDQYLGKDTWESAESELQRIAVELALKKGELQQSDIECIFAGDLNEQCIGSTYALRDSEVPFIGLFGACSTMAESMLLAAGFVNAGYFEKTIAVTSSHFSTAERQFRMPMSYGGQRPQSAQWTVTGAGAVVIEENSQSQSNICVNSAVIGKIVDYEIKDATNMGAAMAPAAADTLMRFLGESDISLEEIDVIVTGDLGHFGSKMLYEILEKDNIDIKNKHQDCGILIFDKDSQDTHSGGSGCGCSASVLCNTFLPMLKNNEVKNVIFMATGALMSVKISQQGETIPSIAHLLHLTNDN